MFQRLQISGWIAGSLLLAPAGATAAEELGAREIMERVDARADGDYSTQDLKMILIDKRGNQRVRELRSFGRDEGKDEYSLMFFLSPPDVEDTGFLTYDYKDEEHDDDQ